MQSSVAALLCALLAILAFGTYMVPLKVWPRLSSWNFMLHMAWGALLSSAAAAFYVGPFPFYWTGVFCGLAWTIGAGSIFSAVQKEESMGAVTVRAMATSIAVSFLVGILWKGESVVWVLALPAVALLLGGLYALDTKALASPLRNWRSYLAGMVFGAYLVPWDPAVHGTTRFMLPLTMGITLGSLIFFLRFRSKATWKQVGADMGMGVLWTAGSIACYTAVAVLGFSVGYPLTQLNLLVAIAWGMLAFGEYQARKDRLRVLLSAGLMIAGGALLGLARA